MTENEAMKNLETLERFYRIAKSGSALHEVLINFVTLEDLVVAIQALEEIQQYRAIGTVEEVKSIVNIGKWGYRKGYAKAIDEFAHQFKENLNQEFPSNYESTRPYFSLENARLIVDDVAEQMKAGGKNENNN